MAELADALDLGSSVHDVQVQVLLSAFDKDNPNLVPVGNMFGFFVSFIETGLRFNETEADSQPGII